VPAAQLTQPVLPEREYVPKAQLEHTSDPTPPVVERYMPAAHLEQLVAPAAAW